MKNQSQDQIVFLNCKRSYRSWPYLIFAIFFSSIGLYVLIYGKVYRLFEGPWTTDTLFGRIAGSTWLLAMLGISVLLWWLILFKPTSTYLVDDKGITLGSKQWPWKTIRSIYLQKNGSKGVYFVFCAQGRLTMERTIPAWPPLDKEQAMEIIDNLEDFLNDKYPQVEVG